MAGFLRRYTTSLPVSRHSHSAGMTGFNNGLTRVRNKQSKKSRISLRDQETAPLYGKWLVRG